MRILFLSNSIGGLMNFRRELIEELVEKGNNVLIGSSIERDPIYFRDLGCKIYPLTMSQRGMNPFKELKLIYDYKRLLNSTQPDIVLSYTIKPNIYGSIACRAYGIPIISSVTGLGTAVEGKGFIQNVTCRLLKYALKSTDHIFFQNRESLDFFCDKGIEPKSSSIIAGSGVNLEKFQFKCYPPKDEKIKFLFTGRILERKGVKLYIEAATTLKKEFPDVEFHLIGIKDDPELSALVENYHQSGTIIFHGQQSDVRPFIANIHCQIHPTYYPEGMSNVLLESAAVGRPAITTDRSGCKEIVEDGITGYIVPQHSLEALIEKMRIFINLSWEKKKEMGEAARLKVERDFDRRKVVDRYILKIEDLTGKTVIL